MGNRDSHKLRELGDLLLELEAAKQDGYLQGLTYLDTARGIGPIVEKLPFYLQDKWMSVGSKYKEDHSVPFPPFSVFCHFIRQEAKARNDPSFNATASTPPVPKGEKSKNPAQRYSVSVQKTSVYANEFNSASKMVGKLAEDPNAVCPLHKKPHALKKCKGFRTMLLGDRKKFLKDKGICFRCCASVKEPRTVMSLSSVQSVEVFVM